MFCFIKGYAIANAWLTLVVIITNFRYTFSLVYCKKSFSVGADATDRRKEYGSTIVKVLIFLIQSKVIKIIQRLEFIKGYVKSDLWVFE